MNKIFVFLLLSVSIICAQNYKQVKIDNSDRRVIESLGNLGIDHIHKSRDGSVDFFISFEFYEKFIQLGIQHVVLIDDWYKHYQEREQASASVLQDQLSKTRQQYNVTMFDYGSMGGFYTLDEVYLKLDEMKNNFPNLITSKDSIGNSYEDRPIYFVKISDRPDEDEDEPEILYTALHHAREPESMMQMIYYMFYLLENYGIDPEVTYLVDNREMYFIPVVNPDGYEYNRQTNPNGGGFWRKNRRNHGNGNYGVDLNRNYGPYEYWNSPNGGSDISINSDTYRGTEPFSEPETAAMKNFLASHEFKAALNYHTYGNYLIYPYGALAIETPDSNIFREFASDMTKYNNYTHGTDMQTVGYSTRGNSDDYFYDGDIESNGKIFAMTPEVGPSFWPPQSSIIPLAEENIHPNLYIAWVSGGFITPMNLELSKDTIGPGDTVYISVVYKNKGLNNFGDFTSKLSAGGDHIEILTSDYSGNSIDSRSDFLAENVFAFAVDDSIEQGQTIELSVGTFMGDIQLMEESLSFKVGNPKVLYAEDFADFESNWEINSNVSNQWETTDLTFYTRPTSVTDSKTGDYESLSTVTMELINSIQLKNVSYPFLSFYTNFEIERGWDYGQCQISADSGKSWFNLPGKYTVSGTGSFQPVGDPVYSGSTKGWVLEEIELDEFIDSEIFIRFILATDEFVEFDGWYIDDLKISYFEQGITDVKNVSQLPDNFELKQNFPNPFNPTTTIEYSIPAYLVNGTGISRMSATNVKLTIFDVLGREVTTLVNSKQSQGNYRLHFDASSLSSGIYFYRLFAGNRSISKKMLLVK